MTKLEQAQELFRLNNLSYTLVAEASLALVTAMKDPGNADLVREAERKLAELQMVQNEFKTKVNEWQTAN